MIGWIRNWMGVENLAYLCYDDRELLAEMVKTIADLVCWGLDQVLPSIRPDLGWGWEDICFRTGPLVSPDIFGEVAVPGYAKISRKLRDAGCDLYLVDCDGMIDALVPGWLEGGVNVMFPVEIGAWKADPAQFRRRWGRELRIFGGIDKLALEKGRAEIDREIERRVPLMREGGYVPLPDHLITPDTPLDDYRYYLGALGRVRLSGNR
jgi:uroporphyrinogen decarboxylase